MNYLTKALLKLTIILIFVSTVSSCTIVPDQDDTKDNGNTPGNQSVIDLVKKYWEKDIPEYVSENSVSIKDALADENKKNHCIQDRLKIEKYDGKSQNKNLIVYGYQDPLLKIQLGPIFKGTALRDGLPFIEADQFQNQIEFASVSSELHKYLLNEILIEFDPTATVGKTVTIQGFLSKGNGELLITPTFIKIEDD